MQGVRVWSLVGEIRSHMPCSQTAKTKQMQYYNKFNKDFLKNGPKECFLFFFLKRGPWGWTELWVGSQTGGSRDWGLHSPEWTCPPSSPPTSKWIPQDLSPRSDQIPHWCFGELERLFFSSLLCVRRKWNQIYIGLRFHLSRWEVDKGGIFLLYCPG